MLASLRGMRKEGQEREKKSGGSLCRQVAKMLAGSLLSRAFSPRSRRLLYRHPPPRKPPPFDHRGRLPSCAYAHSPAPLVLSPGIYNTLCFPSTICLGFSAPSLTLLSRVLFLFNFAVSSSASPPRRSRYSLVQETLMNVSSNAWIVFYISS